MEMLGMTELNGVPSVRYAPQGVNTWMSQEVERRAVLKHIVDDLVKLYASFSFNTPYVHTSKPSDGVFFYARQVLSLGCFYLEFRDATKEGDGDRILRCYRYLLPIFQSSGRKNYSCEALNFLVNHDCILSERQAAELIWSRFVNVHGLPGKNIPNDLHCEHLNRLCKTAITPTRQKNASPE